MKRLAINMAMMVMVATAAISCHEPLVDFNVDMDNIEAEAEGAEIQLNLSAPGEWVAKTQDPWITVSPANGRGSVECRVMVDSSLAFTSREGLVRIEMLSTGERKDIKVHQKGFEHSIVSSETDVNLVSYAPLKDRKFSIQVSSNVPFEVVIPNEMQPWLSYKMGELVLNRGARPRKVNIDFEWNTNFYQEARGGEISFKPLDPAVEPSRQDVLRINQNGADPIEIGVKGDSLALIAINRALGCYAEFPTEERMEHWPNVEVYKSGPNKGRVRYAKFYLFGIKEPLPFQVKYLTAAEELEFFANVNTFLLDLEPGEHICELTQLKRLTIAAYGLSTLPEYFTKLKNLEYLNLASNNFQTFPEILNETNFPNLHSIIMNANQRYVVYDLSNSNKTKNLGGMLDEHDENEDGSWSFPKRLLKWDKLDTLVLSVNYFQGNIPDMVGEVPVWTAAEVNACDTLPTRLIGLPKVLPNAKLFTCNLNRLTGELPEWLLYHPCLDLWMPDALVFPQEGKDQKGNSAGFSNAPASLDYYYKEYVNKKYNPANRTEEDEEE